MRRIELESWEENGEEIDLRKAINLIIASKSPQELPKGIEKFKIFGRIGEAFDKVEKDGVLELEEVDYEFLKGIIEEDIPAQWALNEKIKQEFDKFLNAKGE